MNDEIKICPRCGARLFADMDVCYGCLFDFRNAQDIEVAPEPMQAQGGQTRQGSTCSAVSEKPYIQLGDRRPSAKSFQQEYVAEKSHRCSKPMEKDSPSLSMNMKVEGDVNMICLSIPKDHMEGFKLSQPIMLRICGEDCIGRLKLEITCD